MYVLRESKTKFFRYKTGSCMFAICCFFNSLNTKDHTQKYKTKYFYKNGFTLLYKLKISA